MASPIANNPDVDGSSWHFAAYADASSPVNLVAEGLAPCRRIRCKQAGTLVVKRASDNVQVTLDFLAGETMDVIANSIDSGTASGIVVYW